jgi:hypothetical protein
MRFYLSGTDTIEKMMDEIEKMRSRSTGEPSFCCWNRKFYPVRNPICCLVKGSQLIQQMRPVEKNFFTA